METEGTAVEQPTTDATVTEVSEPEVSTLSEAQLREELARVRRESASRRVELRDIKTKADEWDRHQASLLTEQQKLEQRAAAAEARAAQLENDRLKSTVLRDAKLDEEFAEFITATDEAGMKAQATKLAEKFGKPGEATSSPALDLLAGKRGNPVGSSGTASIDDLIRASARR